MNNKLTKKDVEELQKEFDYRKGPLTMEIAHEKMIAAAHGDRSENAEYKAAKSSMYDNYRRMGYLIKMIRTAIVIDDVIHNTKGANIGDKLLIKFDSSDDIEEIELVLKDIARVDSELATVLSQKANNFEYDAILDLILLA